MPVVRIDAQLTSRQLLKAVEQMPLPELEQFLEQVMALRTRHHAPGLSRRESELLAKINRGVPSELQARYDALIAKRRSDALSEAEYDELLRLTEKVETLDTERVKDLAALARLRKTTLPILMKDLGIKRKYSPPPRLDGDRRHTKAG
ncbi:MAG: STAS/SEC14 domain-containing protein [Nitrospiraceae bacterium]|nr:STAS/SEC14 domain-containing protein [Nitrospiraceae bacterium]